MLESGVTYIADRGYLSFPLLAATEAANTFFVIRAKVNLVYQRLERRPVSPGSVLAVRLINDFASGLGRHA